MDVAGITLLIDIGSTYTKITAVDLEKEAVVGRTKSPSTVATDMTIGLQDAYGKLLEQMGVSELKAERILACSSAAGGLRIVAIGLVPVLTAEAAKRAALGAGAKVVGAYSYKLSHREQKEIEELSPDLILLVGGTDGGNEDVILHNGKMVADCKLDCPIVVAGNKVVAEPVEALLKASGKYVKLSENVMPEIDQLNIEPARSLVREIFMQRIVHAKGLDKAEDFVGGILMPTPMAVLNAARLLAEGVPQEEGIGDLIVIDVGGATTDVHSVSEGRPCQPGVVLKGLPEPFAKRTVEGDLGIRYNAPYILEMAGMKRVLDNMGIQDRTLLQQIDLDMAVEYLSDHIEAVPHSEKDFAIDIGLARTAVEIAMGRHAGHIELFYSPSGTVSLQYGKDLTKTGYVIGTGGIFAYGREPRWVLEGALFNETNPLSLRPERPEVLVDEHYILYALGLLAEIAPEKALRIMKRHLKAV